MRKVAIGFGVLVVLAALVYAGVTRLGDGNGAHAEGPPAFEGLVNAFTVLREPTQAPWGPVVDRNGDPVDPGRFEGRVVLLNFWATWCAPCVAEMPTLDALQGDMGGEDFMVVTLSVDRRGMETVAPFWEEHGFKNLEIFLDPRSRSYAAFGTRGLPTSYLIDHTGKVVGYMEGHAEWNSEAAKALIRYYLERAKGS
jgi:thiol-disulfide isomerase/thioredoxin